MYCGPWPGTTLLFCDRQNIFKAKKGMKEAVMFRISQIFPHIYILYGYSQKGYMYYTPVGAEFRTVIFK